MASVVDAFRENFAERFSLIKYLILTIPVYYAYTLYIQPKADWSNFYMIAGIILFFMFGFLVQLTNNVINEKIQIVPALNPFTIALSSIKGIISVGPFAFATSWLANYLCTLLKGLTIVPQVITTAQYIIWFLAVTFIITAFLFFARKEHIFDAYISPKLLIDKAGDLVVTLIFLIIQLIFANLVTTAFLCYVLIVLFGVVPFTTFCIVYAVVFNIGVIGHCLGQICCEVISYGQNNHHKHGSK